MKRTQILANKTGYLGLKVLKISKLAMYGFRYDYVKPKYGEKVKLYYMDTDSFIVYIKTEDIYVDIEKYPKTRFDTLNYELYRPFSKGKN